MTKLFVYGTLMPGAVAWPRLQRWVVSEPEPAVVPGALYDTGRGYPAATFAPDAVSTVAGVIVELDPARLDTALAALDRYEASEYERMTVRTVAGADAITYGWIAPLDGCRLIHDGRWPIE